MKKFAVIASALALSIVSTTADAQVRRGGFENAAGGVTAGGAHDVRGPWGGRSVGEGGVVTNGDGGAVAGSRGCSRTAAGGAGCRAGTTVRSEDGSVAHQDSGYAEGRFGNTASTQGSLERDNDGDWDGERNTQVNVGDRTYDIDTTYTSGDGFDRDVNCSGC